MKGSSYSIGKKLEISLKEQGPRNCTKGESLSGDTGKINALLVLE